MSDTMLLGLDPNQRIDPNTGHGFVAQDAPPVQHASLSGPAPSFSHPAAATQHPDERIGMMKSTKADGMPRHPQAVRELSPDELMAQANAMLDAQRAQPQGSSLSPRDASGGIVADANGQKLPDWLVREQENGGGG